MPTQESYYVVFYDDGNYSMSKECPISKIWKKYDNWSSAHEAAQNWHKEIRRLKEISTFDPSKHYHYIATSYSGFTAISSGAITIGNK